MNAGADASARLRRAERRGLRLAIFCRTAAVGLAFLWIALASGGDGPSYSVLAPIALFAFTLLGVFAFFSIGSRFDRWWLKYVLYAADILGICALFAFLPVVHGEDVPQVVAFRAFGIYYLFPLIAMSCLSLSWGLVAFSGLVAAAGWWAAFGIAISGMERRLSWGDLGPDADMEKYKEVFFSLDFVGYGNRVEETGFLMIGAGILALAVYRARHVFFAQIAAESERERIAGTLGRYVPEAIAKRLIADPAALTPQVRHGAVLILDIAGFTAFAAAHPPEHVIATLNAFLADCAEVIAKHEGVVISYTGDGLLATFNTPIEVADPEVAALAAARDLTAQAADSSFAIRVGLAAGDLAAGSVGSAQRQAFTVYGDTVNRAARLEALAKTLGETILCDEAVAQACRATTALRACGTHDLRGLAEPVDAWTAG